MKQKIVKCIDCGKERELKGGWAKIPVRCKECNIKRAKHYWRRGLSY